MINWKNAVKLSDEEMADTAKKAVAGNPAAIERLVQATLKLASSLAHNYDFTGATYEDLMGEALLGLVEAIPTFNPEKGVKFTTYANWHMRKRIYLFIINNFRMVRVGKTIPQRKIFWRLHRELRALQNEGINDPDSEMLAERLQVQAKEVEQMQGRMSSTDTSLNAIDPDTGMQLLNRIASDDPGPEMYTIARCDAVWTRNRMIEYEQKLSEKERLVWNYRIAAEDPKTLREVGDIVGTSYQYVASTEQKLQEGFKKYISTYQLKKRNI